MLGLKSLFNKNGKFRFNNPDSKGFSEVVEALSQVKEGYHFSRTVIVSKLILHKCNFALNEFEKMNKDNLTQFYKDHIPSIYNRISKD